MSRRPPAGRIGLAVLLAAVLAGGAGCMYWRLGKLRMQLGRFPRYFEVSADPGPSIRFREPVLHPEDLAWLLQVAPGRVETGAGGTTLAWPLRKRRAVEPEDPALGRIDCTARVERGRIVRVALPERFNRVIDADILEQSFAGSDAAPVDRASFRTGWPLRTTIGIPDEGTVREVLGAPGTVTETPDHRVLEYAYDVARDGPGPGPDAPPDAAARFTFRRGDGRMVLAGARFGSLEVRVLSNDGEAYRVLVQRRRAGG